MEDKELYKLIGENILKQRKLKKLSQEKLSQFSSIDRKYISKIENGKVNITVKLLYKLAKVFQIKLYVLIKEK